jgi:hypothetical protein
MTLDRWGYFFYLGYISRFGGLALPRSAVPLTDMKCRNAKPQEKEYKLSDGHGMYLLVHPKGGKYWRLKYRVNGKEKLLSFGVYPEVSLEEARQKRRMPACRCATASTPWP